MSLERERNGPSRGRVRRGGRHGRGWPAAAGADSAVPRRFIQCRPFRVYNRTRRKNHTHDRFASHDTVCGVESESGATRTGTQLCQQQPNVERARRSTARDALTEQTNNNRNALSPRSYIHTASAAHACQCINAVASDRHRAARTFRNLVFRSRTTDARAAVYTVGPTAHVDVRCVA